MQPIVLDAYAARTCSVKTWNRFALPAQLDSGQRDPDHRGEQPVAGAPEAGAESLRDSFAGGSSFTERALAALLAEFPGPIADLRSLGDRSPQVQEEACQEAMTAGVPLIVGGLLPVDVAGHRSGRADLWVRGADRQDGRAGYHPVIIARRLVTEKRQSGRAEWSVPVSGFAAPAYASAVAHPDRAIRTQRDGVLLQIGHYWRLLQAADRTAPGPPAAGIIGTDEYGEPDRLAITWIDLSEPMVRTFSRSSETGWTLRSVLERYDHEHGFRVRVAENALAGAEPLVTPIRNRECDSCHWWEVCRPQLGADDLSVRIDKAPLDVREISALRALGVRTITDLAAMDLDELKPRYLPEVRHRPAAEQRLDMAARRARLMVESVDLERLTTGPIEVPRADIEIDLDIETAADERVYLWGFLVNDTRTDDPPAFVHFGAWSDLSREEEHSLARRAVAWLKSVVDGPAGVRVYHYSAYEVVRLHQLASSSSDPLLRWGADYASAEFCDLFLTMKDHWFGTRGLGLKVVAGVGAGFRWRDADPSGLSSQAWFDEACHGATEEIRAAARRRVLDYNEDDVRATWQLREWLRDQ